ncbi:MAG: hypothetical protein ACM3VZ_16325 [Acidobacteriota bacterium]
MNQINQLVEQQIRAFHLHQRHVDELAMPEPGQIRRVPRLAKAEAHSDGITGVLEEIGLQFEKALTAILETGRR